MGKRKNRNNNSWDFIKKILLLIGVIVAGGYLFLMFTR